LKKRILCLIQLPPPVHGVSTINKQIVESDLIGEKVTFDIIQPGFSKKLSDVGGVSFYKLFRTISLYLKTWIRLLMKNYDLIYFTFTPSGNAFSRDAILLKIINSNKHKVLVHLHGLGLFKSYQNSGNIIKRWVKKGFDKSNVICLSDKMKGDLGNLKTRKTFVLNNGVQFEDLRIIKKPGPIHLIFFSNLNVSKGIFVFLETLNELNKKNIDFRTSIVGEEFDVTYNQVLEYLDEHNIRNKVEQLGPLYESEKWSCLQESDIMILPTENDSFPLTILEALQAGLVVISTSVGGIPDIIQNGVNGIIIENISSELIANQVEDLISNPDKMSAIKIEAVKSYRNRYTFEVFEKNMLNIFQEIMS